MKKLATLLLGIALMATVAAADTTIRFDRGKYGKTVHGACARGEVSKFWVGAGKGQKMTVKIRSVENNAVFRVVGDGGSLSPDEQTSWSGRLPINGDYLIEVGTTRGGASFDLSVDIR